MEIKTLPCGVRFAFRKSNSSVAYCAVSIKAGTKNEPVGYNGLAHLTEHLLFKGTKNRSSNAINNALERLGGELNAYTTKEETVVHATVLKQDISKAVDLLVDLVSNPLILEKELKKERGVVVDEINSYKDSPADYIYDQFEELFFEGSPLSHQVLGNSKMLSKITPDIVKQFIKENYTIDNMCFTIVGNYDFEKVAKIVNRSFEKYSSDNNNVIAGRSPAISHPADVKQPNKKTIPDDNVELIVVNKFEKVISKRGHQAHSIIGTEGYSLYNDKRFPLVLLVNMLGGPASNSVLNNTLREKNALVYNVEANYAQYSKTGIVTIYFGCDKQNVDKCIPLIYKSLQKFRDELVSESKLKMAKKQLLGQLAIASDNGEAQVLSMGKSILAYNKITSDERSVEIVNAITAQDIQNVAREIFAADKLSVLIYK